MSHFAGFVILTPEYAKQTTLQESIEMYSEHIECDEHYVGDVSDFDKLDFMDYYYFDKENSNGFMDDMGKKFYEKLVACGEVRAYKPQNNENSDIDKQRYIMDIYHLRKNEFAEFIISQKPNIFDNFEDMYEKYGESWNDGAWRIGEEGNWEEYSTYNPNSVYDWYDFGGRWDRCLKTKSGKYVNECLIGEIDWSDFADSDYCKRMVKDWTGKPCRKLKKNVRWHFTKSEVPYCIFIDGIYYSQGKMGWFGMSDDDMTNEEWAKKVSDLLNGLPENSECCLVDFHI